MSSEARRYVADWLDRVRALLESQVASDSGLPEVALPAAPEVTATADGPPLQRLMAAAGLTDFERHLLVLAMAVELDGSFAELCAQANRAAEANFPTVGLALAALPGANWAAVAASAPLRHFGLIRIEPGPLLTTGRLSADERVWMHAIGLVEPDEAVRAVSLPPSTASTTPSHDQVAQSIVGAIRGARAWPAVHLHGPGATDQRAIAAGVCERLGLQLLSVSAALLPSGAADAERLARCLAREALLGRRALLIDGHLGGTEPSQDATIHQLVNRNPGLTFLAGPTAWTARFGSGLAFEVRRPLPDEQFDAWVRGLTDRGLVVAAGHGVEQQVGELVGCFDLTTTEIESIVSRAAGEPEHDLWGRVRAAAREQARPSSSALSHRVESAAVWDDLVLPGRAMATLRQLELHVRHRATVMDRWGFGGRSSRGRGTSVLFAGPSGVGKTLAAEVLANVLDLDLWRIDLSTVVSKYIGETEKNLSRVFDGAESGGAVLLFDEADALFGRRTEVRDSHDRHANIEVGYLLQRIESFRGLAILTTNLKDSIDSAFVRRLRFVVDFPFPDHEARERIWERVFPEAAPLAAIDCSRLAQLNLSGARIRNIALHAAFFAAADGGAGISMAHVRRAAEADYAMHRQPLSSIELAGWES